MFYRIRRSLEREREGDWQGFGKLCAVSLKRAMSFPIIDKISIVTITNIDVGEMERNKFRTQALFSTICGG